MDLASLNAETERSAGDSPTPATFLQRLCKLPVIALVLLAKQNLLWVHRPSRVVKIIPKPPDLLPSRTLDCYRHVTHKAFNGTCVVHVAQNSFMPYSWNIDNEECNSMAFQQAYGPADTLPSGMRLPSMGSILPGRGNPKLFNR